MIQRIKRLWNIVSGVLVAMVFLLAIALAGVRLVGLEPYVVLSGSMEPAYHTGSMIYVKETEPEKLREGDAITYQLDSESVVTHRIVEVTEENGMPAYRTQGDANDMADGTPVRADQVLGTPIFTIPYLGYLAAYLQTTSGRYAAVAVGAGLLLIVFLPDMIFGKDKENKKETEQ